MIDVLFTEKQTRSKESRIQAEMEKLRKMHGDVQPAYMYRLWAEIIVWFVLQTHSKLALLARVAKRLT